MKQYSEDDIKIAISRIVDGENVARAARDSGVPRTTLQRRLNGFLTHSEAAQSQQRLSPVQEKHLTDWALAQAALGLVVATGLLS